MELFAVLSLLWLVDLIREDVDDSTTSRWWKKKLENEVNGWKLGIMLDHIFCLTLIVGGSMLAVPYAFQCSGILLGIFIMLIVYYINHSVNVMLLDISSHCLKASFPELVELVFGKRGKTALQVCTVSLMFSCQIALMVSAKGEAI